jgi:hypothetical protein
VAKGPSASETERIQVLDECLREGLAGIVELGGLRAARGGGNFVMATAADREFMIVASWRYPRAVPGLGVLESRYMDDVDGETVQEQISYLAGWFRARVGATHSTPHRPGAEPVGIRTVVELTVRVRDLLFSSRRARRRRPVPDDVLRLVSALTVTLEGAYVLSVAGETYLVRGTDLGDVACFVLGFRDGSIGE